MELCHIYFPGDIAVDLAVPRNIDPSDIADLGFNRIFVGRMSGHVWEQLELAHTAPSSILFSPCNTGPIARGRQVVTMHDAQVFSVPEAYSWKFRNWYKFMWSVLGRSALAVTTVSRFSRYELERYGVAHGDIQIVPNGVDHIDDIDAESEALRNHGLERGSYILAIGSASAHKNISMLVKAAALRPDSAAPLVLVGGGNRRVFSGIEIESSDGVRVLGRVSDRELKALYQGALALAFPSITEGFGIPPLEAMKCGCPVIASTGGAIPEGCGNAAYYASPFVEEQWVEGMTRLEWDQSLRQSLIDAGYERAAKFSWRASALMMLSVLAAADQNTELLRKTAEVAEREFSFGM